MKVYVGGGIVLAFIILGSYYLRKKYIQRRRKACFTNLILKALQSDTCYKDPVKRFLNSKNKY